MSRSGLALFVLSSCYVFGVGCSSPAPPVVDLPPPEVTVCVPIQKDLSEFLEFTGRTEAIENVELRARVSGYLLSVNFEEGEDVQAGDVLFEIDSRPYDAALKAAEAAVASAEAKLKEAQSDLERARQAFEKEAISAQDFDTAVALEGTAVAAVASAKADIERANLDVEFTRIVSPVDGRVGRAFVTKGNLISAGQSDTPLTSVVSVSPIDVYFDVDERALLRFQRMIRKQDPELRSSTVREAHVQVDVQLADESGFPHKGLLDFTDNQLDPETGTIRVRARLANEDQFLHPGMFVRVRLPFGQLQKRLLIPERAIGTDQGQRYVLVVKDDNSTERRDVTPGVRYSGGLRIIESGIAVGERVIVEGIQRVRPPARVTPRDATVQDVVPEQKDADNNSVSSS